MKTHCLTNLAISVACVTWRGTTLDDCHLKSGGGWKCFFLSFWECWFLPFLLIMRYGLLVNHYCCLVLLLLDWTCISERADHFHLHCGSAWWRPLAALSLKPVLLPLAPHGSLLSSWLLTDQPTGLRDSKFCYQIWKTADPAYRWSWSWPILFV